VVVVHGGGARVPNVSGHLSARRRQAKADRAPSSETSVRGTLTASDSDPALPPRLGMTA
jgi:hypothetical protein